PTFRVRRDQGHREPAEPSGGHSPGGCSRKNASFLRVCQGSCIHALHRTVVGFPKPVPGHKVDLPPRSIHSPARPPCWLPATPVCREESTRSAPIRGPSWHQSTVSTSCSRHKASYR